MYIYIYIYIYICKNENNAPSGYHRNGFEAIHALGHMMYGYIMCTWYVMVTSTVYHVSKCMRCHKAIAVIKKVVEVTLFSWLHIYYYILLVWDLSTLCVVNDFWPLAFCYFFIVIVTAILIFVIMVIITIAFNIRWLALLLLTHHCYFCYHILL